ncbi:MAG: hypothetical protein ACRECN_00590, partial [Methylocella sp.]
MNLQRLQIFKQRFLLFGRQFCAEFVTAITVAGIPVVATGRVQRVVKFGLFAREPNLHLVVGWPDFEGLGPLIRRQQQIIERGDGSVVQVRR